MRLLILSIYLPILLWTNLAWGRPTCEKNPLYCPWVIYYGKTAPLEILEQYNPIVLDPTYSPVLKPLKEKGIVLYGQLDLGEIDSYRKYFILVKEKGLLLGPDPDWPGTYYIDVREKAWEDFVLNSLIPAIVFDGFHGIFLDSVAGGMNLEDKYPEKYAGTKNAITHLVKQIHLYFPSLKIMLDKGYDLLPELGDSINAVVAEAIYTKYNFETKKYEFVKKEIYEKRVKQLHAAQKQFPHLEVFSLDLWFPDQPKVIKKIYATQRANGFRPYVSALRLDRIVPEPK